MIKTTNPDFEALILKEISRAWHANAAKFGWKISPPHFRIKDMEYHLGEWCATTRDMSFSNKLVSQHSWNEVLETIKHEMAHQYVSEALHITDEAPHGTTFQNVCKNNNIDAAPRGVPDADKTSATNHIVEKVRHLLQLASNAGATEAEAKAAAEAAHNMMLKYNIDVQKKNEDKGYTVRYFGETIGRIQVWKSELAGILSKYYFTEVIWITTYDPRTKKDGYELEASGTEENLDVAEYVHDFISRAAVQAWEAKFDSQEFKDQMERDLDYYQYHSDAPQSPKGYAISARSNFLAGFVRGFKSQLQQAEVKEISQGLVLARDPALEEFYKNRHPHIRKLKSGGGFNNARWQHEGFTEGSYLKIPPAAKAAGKSIPLLNK